jgi:hypothetical protein
LAFADSEETNCYVQLLNPGLAHRLKNLTVHILPIHHSEAHATQDGENLLFDPAIPVVAAEANKDPHILSPPSSLQERSIDHRALPGPD